MINPISRIVDFVQNRLQAAAIAVQPRLFPNPPRHELQDCLDYTRALIRQAQSDRNHQALSQFQGVEATLVIAMANDPA